MISKISFILLLVGLSNVVYAAHSACYAPEGIDSECTNLKPVIKYSNFIENQIILYKPKDNEKVENQKFTMKGKLIRFVDENKNYAVQMVDTDQSFIGAALILQISERKPQTAPNQSIETTIVKNYEFLDKKMTVSESRVTFLYTQKDDVNFDLKNMNPAGEKSPLTADTYGSDQMLSNGTQAVTLTKSKLDYVDPDSKSLILSIQSSAIVTPVKEENITSLFGRVFADKIKQFSLLHTNTLEAAKLVNECRKIPGNCTMLEENYKKLNLDRDQFFLSLVNPDELKLRPVPPPPAAINPSYVTVYHYHYYGRGAYPYYFLPYCRHSGSGKALMNGGSYWRC